MNIAQRIDSITSESDSAEETLVKLREFQSDLQAAGELVMAAAVKDFADGWQDYLIS